MSASQLKVFNSIPSEIHYDFNKLTERILTSTPSNIADLVSIAVSRHPYQSPFFDICIKLEMVRRYLSESNGIKKVITNDIEFYKILSQSDLDFKIQLDKIKNVEYFSGPILKVIRKIAQILFITINETLSKDKSRKIKLQSSKSIILIDTFMLQNSINDKIYVDRYYNGLFTYLDKDLKRNIFFLPHIIANYSRKDLKKIYSNTNENIVFKHDFLKLVDYFKAFILLFKHRVSSNSVFYFKNINITNYVKKNIKSEKFNRSSFEALLNYFFIKRLKQNKIKLNLVIDWNENQPIDKGLIKGVHDFFPKIRVKGYRAFIISTDYNLYLMPTQLEVDNKVIPDEIIVIGNGLVDQVRSFCSGIKVSVGPGFRFMDINKPIGFLKNKKSILVALPIGFEDSINIIRTLDEVGKCKKFTKYNIIIRPHPTISIERLKVRVKDIWKINYSWAKGEFRDNVLDSFLFISNTSSSIVEALAYGVPAIIVGSKTSITQNPIPKIIDKRLWRIVYTAEELAIEIDYFINLDDVEKQIINELGAKVKNIFFDQVTKKGVKELLNI
ncbi:hypothetical protein OD91_0742 [Lutibacter sp. Hel_I_33_5]|nr:hypothetical protein OD91_0742 [Lutibacter sp. Hel_I_33_5]